MKKIIREKLEKIVLGKYGISFDPLKIYERLEGYHILTKRNKKYCGKCGEELSKCSCGIKYKKNYSRFKTRREYPDNSALFAYTSNVDNILLIRYFTLSIDEKIGEKAHNFWYEETMRYAITENGDTIFARKKSYQMVFYMWDWIYNSDIEIKKYTPKYDCIAQAITRGHLPKWLTYFKNTYFDKIRNLLTYPEFINLFKNDQQYIETLCKCNRFDLIKAYFKNRELKNVCWLMLKHNKLIPDENWSQYCNMLNYLGKDLSNIDVICPNNFNEKYDLIFKQYKNVCEKRRIENELKESQNYEKAYFNRIKNLLDLKIDNKKFKAEIIPTVANFYDYSKMFNNCLFSMKYFKKEKSFIFVVSDEEKELEVAEIIKDDKKLFINQCFGKSNIYTQSHNLIMEFLSSKLNLIRGAI